MQTKPLAIPGTVKLDTRKIYHPGQQYEEFASELEILNDGRFGVRFKCIEYGSSTTVDLTADEANSIICVLHIDGLDGDVMPLSHVPSAVSVAARYGAKSFQLRPWA